MTERAAEERAPTTLVVPATDERKLQRAASTSAGELILDLEDAVPGDLKEAARATALAFLREHDELSHVGVRVNPVGSREGRADLAALAGASRRPSTVVLPKTETPGDVRLAAARLRRGGRAIPLQALIETPAGLAAIQSIARAGAQLDSLIIGYEDLAAGLGRARVEEQPDVWLAAQHEVVVAARANRIRPVDGPTLELADRSIVERASTRARALGFAAKWAIHPAQLDAVAAAFHAPAEAERARAEAVLAALRDAESRGSSAASLDGRMIDTATRAWAYRILGRAS